MSGLRFKAGELAMLVVVVHPENHGRIIEIAAVGPFQIGDLICTETRYFRCTRDCDYATADRWATGVFDYQLRKIDPPAEPVSLTRESDIGIPISDEVTA